MKKLNFTILGMLIAFIVILIAIWLTQPYPINIQSAHCEELACPDGRVIDTDMMHEYYAAKDFPDKYMKFFCSLPCEEMPYTTPMHDYPGFFIGLSSPSGHCTLDSITFTYVINSQNKIISLMMYDQEEMQHKMLWTSKEAPEGLGEYLQNIIDQSNKIIKGEIET